MINLENMLSERSQIFFHSVYSELSRTSKSTETESGLVGARGWREMRSD